MDKTLINLLQNKKRFTTPKERGAIYTLFSRAGITDKEVQRHIIGQYTYGRTQHTTDMYQYEAIELKAYLQSQVQPGIPDKCEAMRRKIIHFAHLMLWKTENGEADMKRINDWCEKYGQFHKSLNAHTEPELKKLVTQFKKVFESYLTKF